MKISGELIDNFFITKETVKEYIEISGDDNSIHVDKSVARENGFDDIIAHGLLVVGMTLSKIINKLSVKCHSYTVRFCNPVVVNKTRELNIYLDTKKEDLNTLIFSVVCDNKIIIRGSMQI